MSKVLEVKKEEIKAFTLCYIGGLMWLKYKPYKHAFIIDINPYEISKLMRNEGYDMQLFTSGKELSFTNSILINTADYKPVYGIHIIEDGDEEVFIPVCYVKPSTS